MTKIGQFVEVRGVRQSKILAVENGVYHIRQWNGFEYLGDIYVSQDEIKPNPPKAGTATAQIIDADNHDESGKPRGTFLECAERGFNRLAGYPEGDL